MSTRKVLSQSLLLKHDFRPTFPGMSDAAGSVTASKTGREMISFLTAQEQKGTGTGRGVTDSGGDEWRARQ